MGMDQYLLIPFFRGMNIHLPAILRFTRGTRFWPIPTSPFVLGLFLPSADLAQQINHHIFHSIWPAKIFFSVQLSLVGSVDEFLGLSLTAHWKRTQGFSIAFFTHQQLADWPLPGPTGDLLSIEHRWFEFIFRETHDIPLYPTVSHCIFPHAVCLGLCSNPKLGTKSCSYSFLVFRKDFRDCPSPMDPDYIPIIPHCWTLYKLFYNSPFKSASNVINTHWIPFKFPFKSHSNPFKFPFKSHSNPIQIPFQSCKRAMWFWQSSPRRFCCSHRRSASISARHHRLTWRENIGCHHVFTYIYIYITLYITCVYYI